MTAFNFVFLFWLDFISYFFCVEFRSWVSILTSFDFEFLFWLGCISYVYCVEFVSWFPILWPSSILTRLDWELSDQWRQICIIAFYRKDLKPIKSWARTITWILLNLANTGCCWTCCWWCVILSIFRVIFMPIIVLLWSNWGLTEKKNFEPSDWW